MEESEKKDKAASKLGGSSHAERENHKLEIKQSISLNPPRTEKEEIRKNNRFRWSY